MLKLAGLPSETLGNALQRGGIDYVELLRPAQTADLDVEGLRPNLETFRIYMRREGGSFLEKLQRVQAWSRAHGWGELRVSVRSDR